MDELRITNLDLEMTLACNLKCKYCYLSQGQIHNRDGAIADDLIDKAIELLRRYGQANTLPSQSGPRKIDPKVSFYGGEPMMVWPKVEQVVNKAKERGVGLAYTMFTNGTLGTPEIAKFCKENRIHLVRGVNGCREAQELTRPGTTDTYNVMTKTFNDERGHRRMTIVPQTAQFISQSVREFIESGCSGATPMPDYYADWTNEATEVFMKELRKISEYYLERWELGKPFYSFFLSKEMACRFKNIASPPGCAAARSLHCLSIDGYLMMCHRFSTAPRDSDFCYGHIDEILSGTAKGYGPIVKNRIKKCLENTWNEKCKTCVAQYGCEKGCHHANYINTGDIDTPSEFFCRIRQESAKIVNWLDSRLRQKDPDWWVKSNPRYEGFRGNKKPPEAKICPTCAKGS